MQSWWQKLLQEDQGEQTLLFKDDLTSIYNRRFYKMRLKQEIQKNYQKEHSLSFLMLDLDRFKSINDTYGHQRGDQALIHVSHIMKNIVRERGFVIRYAGDEFLIILPDQGRAGAQQIAEEIGYTVASQKFEVNAQTPLHLTMSIGCASAPEDDPAPEALFELADSALYVSKENGRNQVSQVGDKVKSKESLVGHFPCPALIGRQGLLETFYKYLEEFERSHLWLIGGETGLGKTRLHQEFSTYLKKSTAFRSLETQCEKQDQRAYVSLMSVIDQLLWMEMEDKNELLAHLDDKEKYVVGHYFPHIKMGIEFDVEDIENFIQEKDRLFFTGIEKILKNISKEKTLVFLFDDVHWIDEYTLGLFIQIIRHNLVPLLIIGFYSTPLENTTPLGRLLHDERITQLPVSRFFLSPLNLQETQEMLQAIRPKFEPDAEVLALFMQYCKGVPRFIETVLERLIASQKLFWVEEKCRTQMITPLDFIKVLEEQYPHTSSEDLPFFKPLTQPYTELDFDFSGTEQSSEETKVLSSSTLRDSFLHSTVKQEDSLFHPPLNETLEQKWAKSLEQLLCQHEDLWAIEFRPQLHEFFQTLLFYPNHPSLQKMLQHLGSLLVSPQEALRKKTIQGICSLYEHQKKGEQLAFHLVFQPQILRYLDYEKNYSLLFLFSSFLTEMLQDLILQGAHPSALQLLKVLSQKHEEEKEGKDESVIEILFEKIRASQTLHLLISDIQSHEGSVQQQAIQFFAYLGENCSANLISILLHSDNFRTRLACLKALEVIGPSALKLATSFLNEDTSPSPYCRILSVIAGLPSGLLSLQKALSQSQERIRDEGFHLLFQKRKEEAFPLLQESLAKAPMSLFPHFLEAIALDRVTASIPFLLKKEASPALKNPSHDETPPL